MNNLGNKRALFIVPHLKTFLGNQINRIAPFFETCVTLLTIPRFSKLVTRIPLVERYFRFTKLALNSVNNSYKPCFSQTVEFFSLPISIVRKRNPFLISRSCQNTIQKKKIHFDIIHSHFLDLHGWASYELKAIFNKPVILTAHGQDAYKFPFQDSWNESISRTALQQIDIIITVSRNNAEKLRILGVPNKRLRIIPNGFDHQIFHPISTERIRKTLCLPTDKRILLSVGNLVEEKGHKYLISAMPNILRKYSEVVLFIIGSGPKRENLVSQAKKMGLNKSVRFLGSKPHEEIPLWMNACDFLVLPSLSEGFPTVIPESLACGKPVLGSNVGGIPEAITNDELGRLFEPKNPGDIAEKILDGLEADWNPQNITSFAQRFSWETIVEEIIKVYEEVL